MVTRFYQDLGGLNDIEQVRLKAGALKAAYDKFSRLANEKLVSPQLQIQQIQQQLQAAQIQKDELQKVLQDLELSSTKAKLETDFLRRELKTSEQKHLQLQLELKKAQSASTEDFLSELVSEEKRVQAEMEILGKEIKQVEDGLKDYLNQQTDQAKQLRQIEAGLFKLQDELSKQKDKESGLSIEKAKFDTQMEVLCEEIGRILGVEIFDNIKQAHVSGTTPDLEQKILRLKNQLEMIGGMDELTLKEYQETEARYTNLSQQVEDLSKSMSDLRSIMDELDEHIKSKFNDAFHKVNEKFEHYFRLLFGGGRAVLSLVKEEEKLAAEGENTEEVEGETALETLRPEEKIVKKYEHGASNIIGIDIKATPPGKKLTHIQALSGGERSLTSIALLCSMLTCFPSPFVVLDEVDAALDDANTIRFGQILGTLAHQTQFITITHNRETMAQSNILYGVTMGDDGVSKLLSVKLEQAKQFAK
jgi:chromosome segregation protein